MSISTDLRNFFPNFSNDYYSGSVVIKEKNVDAKVKSVVLTNSDFHFVDTAMAKEITGFFQKANSPEIFNWDCDGIVLFEEKGKKYFFLFELKSSFDTSKLYHAMHQIISSHIKTNMLLHLQASYNVDEYIFEAFIVSHPPKDDFKRDLQKKMQLPPNNKYKTEAEFSRELYIERMIEIKPTACEKLKSLNLGHKCSFNTLRFRYIEVPLGNDSINLDVTQYT